ncbi:hypothetical protein TEHAL1_02170 [Tetragenococcus halophilus]|nr:hypothetical protein TEHAL1_02170 [Tetragenococcus halophilus]GMG65271.1 hypothetical protein TEHIT2_04620 [Tetragenococcus halophilus]
MQREIISSLNVKKITLKSLLDFILALKNRLKQKFQPRYLYIILFIYDITGIAPDFL